MILGYKYQEIMEHIEVTPEMRERILRTLQNSHAARQMSQRMQIWVPFAAAACLMLVFGIFQIRNGMYTTPMEEAIVGGVDPAMPGETICMNLEELSALSGFTVPDISGQIPFPVEETRFSFLWNELAQAIYTGTEQQEITLRVSNGTEDNSGVYDVYENTGEWTVADTSVTVKGDAGQYALAVWVLDGKSYSIFAMPQQAEDNWRNLIEAAVSDS